jgi:hypothetical protein
MMQEMTTVTRSRNPYITREAVEFCNIRDTPLIPVWRIRIQDPVPF